MPQQREFVANALEATVRIGILLLLVTWYRLAVAAIRTVSPLARSRAPAEASSQPQRAGKTGSGASQPNGRAGGARHGGGQAG